MGDGAVLSGALILWLQIGTGPYDSNNSGYWSFFKLNNGIYKKFYV